jgi:hypothetical protein
MCFVAIETGSLTCETQELGVSAFPFGLRSFGFGFGFAACVFVHSIPPLPVRSTSNFVLAGVALVGFGAFFQ